VELRRDIGRQLKDEPEEQGPELAIVLFQNQQEDSEIEPEHIQEPAQIEERGSVMV
jgi:hypothetical protein